MRPAKSDSAYLMMRYPWAELAPRASAARAMSAGFSALAFNHSIESKPTTPKGAESMAQADACTISAGVTVNGRLSGNEPVVVYGRVEGAIQLANQLTIEEGGHVTAEVQTQVLTVRGSFNGDVVAEQIITLHTGAQVTGNLKAPRIIIEEGARFKGNIEMDVK